MSAYRFDLDKALALWRQSLAYTHTFSADDLDELEQHLRDQVAGLMREGLVEEAAYRQALREMGGQATARREYQKVYWGKLRRRSQVADEFRWRLGMLKNYAKVALRNVQRHKGYVALNVGGLAVGMMCCMLILLYVQHEWSYDRFHAHADRIVRLTTHISQEDQHRHAATAPLPLVRALDAVPGIAQVATLTGPRQQPITYEEASFDQEISWASPAVFEVFTLPLRQGDPATALTEPLSVVLTAPLAEKLFGDADPMGEVLTIDEHAYTVTGVLAPVPSASHWRFDALTSEASFQVLYGAFYERIQQNWSSTIHAYLLLPESSVGTRLADQLTALAAQMRADAPGATYTFQLQPLTDIHLHSDLRGELSPPGDLASLYVFSVVAVLILLVACINFMNLATARSARRAREVGVRKAVGAQRGQLVGQFLGEALLISGFALGVALLLTVAMLPVFNDLIGQNLTLDAHNAGLFVGGLMGTALLVGLVAGSYPAFFLSSFQPMAALRNRFGPARHGRLRKALVVVQFAVSSVFIVGTGVVYSQLDYMRHKDLGFEHEQVLTLSFGQADQLAAFKETLLTYPGILHVTASMGTPGLWAPDNVFTPDQEEASKTLAYHWLAIDPDFAETYGLEIVEGRDLDPAFPSDATEAFLLNETAVRALGWDDPVGRTIQLDLNDRQGTVVGVVKDFHHASLHEPIVPLLLYQVDHVFLTTVSVRIRPEDIPGTLAFLQATWETFQPDQPFAYTFLDDAFARLYEADAQFARMAGVVSLLAVLVACLGLFGLAAFAAEQRTKEIGIRKVLGATIPQVVALLSRDFLLLVGLAFVAALPVAYLLMQQWLADFAYRVTPSWTLFLGAGLLVLLIGLLTVSYQAVKAATANPVNSLRSE